jgi:hypothetical protein
MQPPEPFAIRGIRETRSAESTISWNGAPGGGAAAGIPVRSGRVSPSRLITPTNPTLEGAGARRREPEEAPHGESRLVKPTALADGTRRS